MQKATDKKYFEELVIAFSVAAKDKKLLADFLEDLLTPKELIELPKRLEIVKMLTKGVPQRTIADKLKIGVGTVTRGSKELSDATGGFTKLLKKLR